MKTTLTFILMLMASPCARSEDALEELMQKYGKGTPPAAAAPVAPAAAAASKREPASTTRAKPTTVKRPPPVPTSAPSATPSAAPAAPAEPVAAKAEEAEEPTGLLGSWGGLKPYLTERGIELGLAYKGDTMGPLHGGTKYSTSYLGNVDLTADLNLEKLVGANGLSLFLYGLGNHGGDPSVHVNNSAGVDNIEAPNTFKLYEAYLKQDMDDRFSVLLGLRDLNADYFSTETSKPFISPSFGIGTVMSQTGVNGPSIFPTTSLALNFKYQSPSSFYFQSGVFDAQSGDPNYAYGTQITHNHDEGLLMVWEAGWSKDEDNGGPCKMAVGGFTYTQETAAVDTNREDARNYGYYLLLDHRFTEKFSAFLRYGTAEDTVNTFESSLDVGVVAKGLLKSRPEDRLGLGVTQARFTEDYKTANDSTAHETVVELLYRMEFPRGLAVQPDLQYVIYPSGVKGDSDVTVGAVRVEIEF